MKDLQLSLFNPFGLPVPEEIYSIFPDNESSDLEYKSAKQGFPQSFWETYSAFANTEGGLIILGVTEKKGNFKIEGLEQEKVENYKKIFWNGLNNPSVVNRNVFINEDVKEVLADGKTILAFNVRVAKREEKPIFKTKIPFGNTFKRNYEGDYKCTDDEVRRMLADADPSLHHDSRILVDYSLEDIDTDSIKRYRQLFSSDKPTHPWLTLTDIELLRQLGGYRKDRVSKREGFTLAGILMFGKNLSITDIEASSSFFPDYRENLSEDETIRWTDRIHPDGSWEANLFQFYLRVWPKISLRLPKPFILEEGRRKDETPAHVALREAFINTLVHADYTAPGSIIIESRKEMFRFSNPGTLLVTLHQYYLGGISECRNPNLQKMFMMVGSAEKAGSGVNKIFSGWDQAHWQSPYLNVNNQPDRIELNMPMFSILPQDTLEHLQMLFGESVQSIGKDRLTVLAICEIEGEISNNRLQYALDLHKTDITKLLQDLCKEEYLISENKGRWTSYHLNIVARVDTSAQKVDTSEPKVDTSEPKVDTSEPKVDTSEPKVDTFVPKVDTSEQELKAEEKKYLFKKKKMSKKELHKLILDFCDDYKSLEDIAIAIEREPSYIQNKILPEMVREGILEKKYPHTPNHPGQSYKTTDN
jgi:predicted HTH transcriptional regulator